MPSFTTSSADLMAQGPLVEVFVTLPHDLAKTIVAKGEAVPPPFKAAALVDTGATATVINPAVVKALGLSPVGMTSLHTASKTVPAALYHVDVAIPNGAMIGGVRAVEATLADQSIQCLIGRDILRHSVFVYIGYKNQFTLSF